MTVTEWAMPTVDNIRAEMARKRKRQADLAALLGIAQSGVSARMNGKVPFDLHELFLIADWLGVSVHALLADPHDQGSTRQYLPDSADFAAAA